MAAKDKIDSVLQGTIMVLIVALVSLNLYMAYKVNTALTIRPKQVLETLEKKLVVTPEMVVHRLDEIEASHMKWVKEYRDSKASRVSDQEIE